jgi:hypothetical protein
MAKVVKFAISGKGDYYLPVGPNTTVSYGNANNILYIGVAGNVIQVSHAADTAGANVIGLSKAIYDVLKDSQLFEVTWTPAQAVTNLEHDLLA